MCQNKMKIKDVKKYFLTKFHCLNFKFLCQNDLFMSLIISNVSQVYFYRNMSYTIIV